MSKLTESARTDDADNGRKLYRSISVGPRTRRDPSSSPSLPPPLAAAPRRGRYHDKCFLRGEWLAGECRARREFPSQCRSRYIPERVCKIRWRRARGLTSKGIYPVWYDAGGYEERQRKRERKMKLGLDSCARVSSANAFSPLSECLRCSQWRTTMFLPICESESEAGSCRLSTRSKNSQMTDYCAVLKG